MQGEAGSTGDRPGYGPAAVLARRMSGNGVLAELLLDAGAVVDEVSRAQAGPHALDAHTLLTLSQAGPGAAPRTTGCGGADAGLSDVQ